MTQVHPVTAAIRRAALAFAGWVRKGYPAWASPHGHVALVALCGRDDPFSVSSHRVPPS
jgi:hypothetical protein